MRVVVTGAAGQLGQDVMLELARKNHEAIGTDRTKLDITNEADVFAFIGEVKPDVILHCAAYTNVDAAEENEELAYQINASGTEYLAKAAAQVGAKILYVSTDYVFDGTASEPYEVNQQTKPLGAYGRTKLAGEELLQKNLKEFFIVRTAWVFGIHGNNFVKTMLRLGAERGEVGVVHDQVGSPTYTVDLARFMVELMDTDKYGIYHATNSGVCSWYEFAVEIFKQAVMNVTVNPLTSDQFPRPAARPQYSVLNKNKIKEKGLTPLRDWKEALAAYLDESKR
ncbi:dTDP-4-dehydrorhamnose reductase [Neobacillus bataviensis LMG 21833]|uniref:dTDP-4-dehydrorhamnose reductase n=1 Tax=Neobacillus bataviensis LMG 21833 TaxID=1117379 RepID=K6ED24_9BACI|nr:dTDP-4-dehydrorhamnose reductase [Neobacillus bataviensis]EKN71356.1 dTDP-4-dehydrorhamnose reductase [Neobacillus bataviensis LMG 21833]